MIKEHDDLLYLRGHNPALRLFQLDNFPLIASFLKIAFKDNNRSVINAEEITTQLADYIYSLSQDGTDYPDSARNYLEKWTQEGFLRKYYSQGSDNPVFELTPSSEKALQWITELRKREFVGTESRLLKIFDLLREIVYKSSDSPKMRLELLNRQKEEIEREIEKVRSGEADNLSETKIKERFFEINDTARKMLSDFREIEYNFRSLDRQAREKQINRELSKGRFLQDIFEVHDLIWETDQGRSFQAFWEFLMSSEKQDELELLTGAILELPALHSLKNESIIERFKVDLIDAGEKVNKTNHNLIEQLRRYLDDRMRSENKRIMEIIGSIKSLALKIRETPPSDKDILLIDDRPDIELVMERPFFSPPSTPVISISSFEEGIAEIDTNALYEQIHIDTEELKKNIRHMLLETDQVTLLAVLNMYPVEKGLAELIAYFEIASKDNHAVINDEKRNTVSILDKEKNKNFTLSIPEVIYIK